MLNDPQLAFSIEEEMMYEYMGQTLYSLDFEQENPF